VNICEDPRPFFFRGGFEWAATGFALFSSHS
jgi:hypothetical protein